MKRWEPIKTEKKQLGGIIKLLQKVAPKLASKAEEDYWRLTLSK